MLRETKLKQELEVCVCVGGRGGEARERIPLLFNFEISPHTFLLLSHIIYSLSD